MTTPEPDRYDRTGHYFVQRRRRFGFLEDWRAKRREVGRGAEARLAHSPVRHADVGFLVGDEAGVPMRVIDARIVELAPGVSTSTHRHAHDDLAFVVSGSGTTEIAGDRFSWARNDVLHIPSLSWHRHRADSDARLLVITDAPLVAGFGLSRLEDIGDAPPRADDPPLPTPPGTGSAYERELAATAASWAERRAATRHTRYADVTLKPSPKGSRSALLVDGSLGFRTTGLSMALFEIAAGAAQSKHRHPGEAILYIVDGEGYSVIDGKRYDWKTGDAVIVHQYVWHQHFNRSSDRPATVIRMHMWESIIQMMQAAMDPVPLYEDEPGLEGRMAQALAEEG